MRASNYFAMAALLAAAGATGVQAAAAAPARGGAVEVEDYVREPMPPEFQVLNNELEGPVYADAGGHTFYVWPFRPMRIGQAGDPLGKSTCEAIKYTENGGFMEPYPGGLMLPEVETRPSCVQAWPPVLASADAKPIGKWTVIARGDGAKQWAYGGQPVYTSFMDHAPGDVLGASGRGGRGNGGRHLIGPPPNVPPGFAVAGTFLGRMLTLDRGRAVFTYDRDALNKSNCSGACLQDWKPVPAPALAESHGEFSIFERAPGTRQWAFRGKPLYTYLMEPDGANASVIGADEPGWHNVYTQRVGPLPKDFTLQDSMSGIVIADSRGMTIYRYNCGDDAQDQLSCDHPDAPQDYRFAICGAGDPEKCVKTFPYVVAGMGAKSESRLWTVMAIDPKTGRRGTEGHAGILRVWAYRARPVYTYFGDREPGDRFGDGRGEGQGGRNGFTAMMTRDDYFNRN